MWVSKEKIADFVEEISYGSNDASFLIGANFQLKKKKVGESAEPLKASGEVPSTRSHPRFL